MLRLVCITAHPDDEAGAFGGTLLHCARRGVETHVICLTPGQAASHRGNSRTPAELAALRRAEFAASCKILEVTRAHVLDYEDAALYRTDLFRVAEDLAGRIRNIRPHSADHHGYGGRSNGASRPFHGFAVCHHRISRGRKVVTLS